MEKAGILTVRRHERRRPVPVVDRGDRGALDSAVDRGTSTDGRARWSNTAFRTAVANAPDEPAPPPPDMATFNSSICSMIAASSRARSAPSTNFSSTRSSA